MRVERWDLELAAAVAEAECDAFEYGRHDCATWAFGVAARLRGEPPVEWPGRYSTLTGAKRLMKAQGVTRLEEIGHRLLGAPLTHVALARRGDVCFAGAFGVCLGREVAFVSVDGLERLPLAAMQLAWRV